MTVQTDIDLDAPIVPGDGLGGLHVRVPLAQVQSLFVEHLLATNGRLDWLSMTHLAEATYRLGPVQIAVDVRNGKIFKLTALSGYRGQLFEKLAVDMSVARAMELEPRLYYDESEEMLLIKGCHGVSLDVPAVDPDPREVPTYRISAISVIAPEALTVEGLEGRW
jgi:hypothetical protein